MDGRVQDDQGSVELAALVAQGKARKEGKGHSVPVNERQRGRLTLGEVTLLWQFVVPPPRRRGRCCRPTPAATTSRAWTGSSPRS